MSVPHLHDTGLSSATMPRLPAEILTIEGPDALNFAHAQLASDVNQLRTGSWQWSAWLNPQGRVRALLQLIRPRDEQLLALLRGGTATAMAAALAPYVMRRRVTITAQAPKNLCDAPSGPDYSMHMEGDDTVLGLGSYAMRITSASSNPAQGWRLNAILAGHPWLPDAALDTLLAPSLSLEKLGAASLDKGCFPGQEIVARLHYRGGCKQHIRCLNSDAPLPPGSVLSVDGENVGITLDSAITADGDSRALAVVRDSVPHGETRATIGNTRERYVFVNTMDENR